MEQIKRKYRKVSNDFFIGNNWMFCAYHYFFLKIASLLLDCFFLEKLRNIERLTTFA